MAPSIGCARACASPARATPTRSKPRSSMHGCAPWSTSARASWPRCTRAATSRRTSSCRTRQRRGGCLFLREQALDDEVDDHAAQAVDQRADQRGPEIRHRQAIEHGRCGPEHQRVDHEQEQPEAEHGHRQGQQHEHGPQQGVQQAQHQGGDQRRAEALDFDARVKVGHQQQGAGEQQPTDEDFGHGREHIGPPAPAVSRRRRNAPSPGTPIGIVLIRVTIFGSSACPNHVP
mmetsp:Transcript_28872/g.52061  ORF Transcript_28872/g.52061 Transcript_28872/m.52061 type:complete len:232 (+) Transcript_28872:329-1024(+)